MTALPAAPLFLRAFLASVVVCALTAAPPAGAEQSVETLIEPKGYSYTVSATINESAEAQLIIDTGSSFTVVSEQVAARLGLKNLRAAPRFPLSTAGGVAWVRLVVFDSVTVGGITAVEVEGAVSSGLGDEVDGLLGRSFLDGFIYKIDGKRRTLTLKPTDADGPADGPAYGGHGKGWWKERFSRYAGMIRRFESYGGGRETGMMNPTQPSATAATGFTRRDIAGVTGYYRRLHRALERRARSLGVPNAWIVYP